MLRSATSSRRGKRKLRPKVVFPKRHRYSEAVPTADNQQQKLLRSSHEIARNVTNRNMPAGCRRGSSPVAQNNFRFIKEAIGSQPSTPAGRAVQTACPPVS